MNLWRLLDPVMTIEDDRGERRIYTRRKRSEHVETKHKLWAAEDELEIGSLRRFFTRRMLVRAAVILLMMLASMPALVLAWRLTPPALHAVPDLIFMLGWMYVSIRAAIDVDRDAIVEVYTRYALCPCCGYWLDSIEAEADGLTVCPECGAAWRLSEEHPRPAGES